MNVLPRNVGCFYSVLVGALALVSTTDIVYAAPGDTELISVNTSGAAAGCQGPAISADERFVLFCAQGPNIAPGPASTFQDVFVRDRQLGVTERVSVGLAGAPTNGHSCGTMTPDGRYVVFASEAAKLVKISNTGTAVLPISSIALGGWNPRQFAQANNCPANLAVGASCTVSVVFKPVSVGSKAAFVNITPGGGAAMRSVALAGSGRR